MNSVLEMSSSELCGLPVLPSLDVGFSGGPFGCSSSGVFIHRSISSTKVLYKYVLSE